MYAVMTIELDGYDDVCLEYPNLKAARCDLRKLVSCQARFARVGVGSQKCYIPRRSLKAVAVKELMA